VRIGAAAMAVSVIAIFSARAIGAPQGPQILVSASTNTAGPLGVYAGTASPDVVEALGQSIGEQPAYAMDFLDGTSWQSIEDPSWFLSQWNGSGYKMIWGVPILPDSFSPDSNVSDTNGSASGLAQGANGNFDQYFVNLAEALVAGGQGDSIIRLGWEFNGGWFPWAANGSASNFVQYWQNIVTSMRSVTGQNFTFEWNPTLGDLGVGDLANYYPGDDFVDFVGADVYDQNWASYPGVAAEFATIESETYGLNWLVSFAVEHGKQITLPEWGLGSGKGDAGAPLTVAGEEVAGGDDPTFINDMATWIKANDVFEATFYDVGQSAVDSATDPNSFAALIRDFGPTSSSTTTTQPLTTTTTTQPPTTSSTTTTTTQPNLTTTTTAQPPTTSSTTTTTTQPPTSSSSTTTTEPPPSTPTTQPATFTATVFNSSLEWAVCRAINYYTSEPAGDVPVPRWTDMRVEMMLSHVTGGMGEEAEPLQRAIVAHDRHRVRGVYRHLKASVCPSVVVTAAIT
jgi:hypothetical protein